MNDTDRETEIKETAARIHESAESRNLSINPHLIDFTVREMLEARDQTQEEHENSRKESLAALSKKIPELYKKDADLNLQKPAEITKEERQRIENYLLQGEGEPPPNIDRFTVMGEGNQKQVIDLEGRSWNEEKDQIKVELEGIIYKALFTSVFVEQEEKAKEKATKKATPEERAKELSKSAQFAEFMETFVQALSEAKQQVLNGNADPPITSITVKETLKKIDFPVDIVNSKVWKLMESDAGQQLQIDAKGKNLKRGRETPKILYRIDFSGLEDAGLTLPKRLDPYDKRVYCAVSSLYEYHGTIMTIAEIYSAMGCDGTPGANDRKKINEALSKMRAAVIVLNNEDEAREYNYPYFEYDGSLLPMERVQALVNGQAVESAIHLFREPPLFTFSRQRDQVTTISRRALQSGLNNTVSNLELEDYLIIRAARARRGSGQKKILYETIFKNCGITTTKQKQRAKTDKIPKILNAFIEGDLIKGYSQEKDGIQLK